mgnify:CR=1 FL=1
MKLYKIQSTIYDEWRKYDSEKIVYADSEEKAVISVKEYYDHFIDALAEIQHIEEIELYNGIIIK